MILLLYRIESTLFKVPAWNRDCQFPLGRWSECLRCLCTLEGPGPGLFIFPSFQCWRATHMILHGCSPSRCSATGAGLAPVFVSGSFKEHVAFG